MSDDKPLRIYACSYDRYKRSLLLYRTYYRREYLSFANKPDP
ncbi:MAG: hypothetical protein V7K27_29495 [Nostoc sp.]